MKLPSSNGPTRLRRIAAALMALAVLVTSFTVSPLKPLPQSGNGPTIGEFATYGKDLPKPCRNGALPGTVSPCQVLNFSLNAVPATPPDFAIPVSPAGALWCMNHSSLLAQCGGGSPYRPPRAIA